MLAETSRAFGYLPKFLRLCRVGTSRVNKFSTAVSAQPEESKDAEEETSKVPQFEKFRFAYPDLLPCPNVKIRNPIREKLERRDMIRRRNVLPIPEFYVGSVLAVTTSDKHVPDKMSRFVGICIMKRNSGLNSIFALRNVIEHQGVEVIYHMYSPVIHNIEVLRLEKRLDEELFYLREAPNEYSTFPMDMLKEHHDENTPVPINPIKVPLNPGPWHQKFEKKDLKGVIFPEMPEKVKMKAIKSSKPWEKYDLMDQYRRLIPEEEQKDIFSEILDELKEIEKKTKIGKRKKVFVKPKRQKLF